MDLKNRFLPKIALFAALMGIFGLIEYQVWTHFANPLHPVPRRHIIQPNQDAENKLFAEFDGSAKVQIPIESDQIHFDQLQGVQFKTGSYGKTIHAEAASLTTEEGKVLCSSSKPFSISENEWTSVMLTCVPEMIHGKFNIYLNVNVTSPGHWALYRIAPDKPAVRIWSNDPALELSYVAARNYGNLWDTGVLFSLRILCRGLLAFGVVLLVFERKARVFLAVSVIWLGIFWGQFFETVTYQNSDETQHTLGAVQAITPSTEWHQADGVMRRIAAKVQFEETFIKPANPIIPGRDGVPWVSADGYYVSPSHRSGLYGAFFIPVTKVSLWLGEHLQAVCSDPVTYMRGFLALFLTLMILGQSLMYRRSHQPVKFWALITVAFIPSVLASLLTVWNYSILTIFGAIFCANLIPEKSSRSFRYLLYSSTLIPVLGEFARSQMLWFFVGPIAVTASWVFTTSGRVDRNRRVLGIAAFAIASFASYWLLSLLLGANFIPDRTAIVKLLGKFAERGLWPASLTEGHELLFLSLMAIGAWIGASIGFFGIEAIVLYMQRKLNSTWQQRLKIIWAIVLVAGVLIVLKKCLSMGEVEYLRSLAGARPWTQTFFEHFKEGYRALMSQTFAKTQDYFLVQTFFMAYGWLEITGHWLVYFVFRHLIEVGVLIVLFSSLRTPRAFIQFYAPMWICFGIYFIGIWIGTWSGHFTIVGRFVFPAIALFFLPIPLAAADILATKTEKNLVWINRVSELIFIYLMINSIYGVFYLLPLRFTVGL